MARGPFTSTALNFLLHEAGAKVIAVSDSVGAIFNKDGLDVPELIHMKTIAGHVHGFPGSESIDPAALLTLKCDILVPAALENAVTAENASSVGARIIAEAANGPLTPAADRPIRRADSLSGGTTMGLPGFSVCNACEPPTSSRQGERARGLDSELLRRWTELAQGRTVR